MRLEEFVTAAEVIDELEQGFEVDGQSFRLHLVTEASRAAKTTEDRKPPLIQFALELADHALAAKLPGRRRRQAGEHCRSTGPQCAWPDRQIADRDAYDPVAQSRRRAAASDRRAVTLQSAPTDPAASLIDGKYRCFVEGSWPAGLQLLAQSSDQPLKDAAVLDLAAAVGDRQAAVAAGDAWFALAEAESSLAHAFSRASHWYQQALSTAAGLECIKLEKRLEQIAGMSLPQPTAGTVPPLPMPASC